MFLGSTYYGFPDEDYFRRVKEEMALRGVAVEKLDENPIQIGKKFVEDCKQNDKIKSNLILKRSNSHLKYSGFK